MFSVQGNMDFFLQVRNTEDFYFYMETKVSVAKILLCSVDFSKELIYVLILTCL